MTSPPPLPAPTRARLAASLLLVAASGLVVLVSAARRIVVTAPPPAASATVAAQPSGNAPRPATASTSRWQARDAGAETEASCAIADRGKGPYGDWQALPVGRMVVPVPPPADHYDVLIHFHGGESARRLLAPAGLNLVIATVDAGVGSKAYGEAYHGPQPLEEALATIHAALSPAQLRYLILSSWSAGYGAVREVLRAHPSVPNAVILLDSVHASYQEDGESLLEESLAPFVSLSQRAKAEAAVVVLTHSEIRPPDYASTAEVASYLIAQVSGRRRYAGLLPVHGIEAKTTYDAGMLHIRGFTGTGKEAHCAHLKMLPDILRDDVLPVLRQR
ncbi:MAG: hypothetical protein JRI68_14560 [Deltaproteobacteria bacterium]|nr:hypothetical protein [Deltaproteobacteria bacterium]